MRSTIDMQSYGRVEDIDEYQAKVRILADVSQARKDSVASEFGVRKRPVIQHKNESRLSKPWRAVAVSVRIGGCDEHHFLPTNELNHLCGQPVAHLTVIEPFRTHLAIQLGLHLAFTRSSVIHHLIHEILFSEM